MRRRSRRVGAFTLVEMLVVIAIIVVLSALLAPAVTTILRGTQITQASDMLVSELTLARQTATSNNCSVEVRFYQYGSSDFPGEQAAQPATGKYRAVQLFRIDDSGTVTALGKVTQLPQSIIIDSNTTLSTLLLTPLQNPTVPIPRVGTNYNWCFFRFRPDGSTNLSPTTPAYWCLTLHNIVDGDNRGSPPPNYATVQVDPIGGGITSYRP